MKKESVGKKTILDFGRQWVIHGELRDTYWSSKSMFEDHFPNHFDFSIFSKKVVLEVGSGSGRILNMLTKYNPLKLIGVEPSSGFEILKQNTREIPNLKLINKAGSDFEFRNLDVIVSLGVIHHIPNPNPVIKNVYDSLKKGGYFILWVYGHENNKFYVLSQRLVRVLSSRFPDRILNWLSFVLTYIFDFYGVINKNVFFGKLSLNEYYINVFAKCPRQEKKYIIYDQLNPSYSKYYKKDEVHFLLDQHGFKKIELWHRHNYSWTAIAQK